MAEIPKSKDSSKEKGVPASPLQEKKNNKLSIVSPMPSSHEGMAYHPHIYSVESAKKGAPFSPNSGQPVFRTTSTAAIAVDVISSSSSSPPLTIGTDDSEADSKNIHSALDHVNKFLIPGDKCVLTVALEGNCFLVVVSHCEGQSAILILEPAPSETWRVVLVIPVDHNTKLKLDGDGGFLFDPHSATHHFTFKPSSVRSLWSAVQSLLKTIESADIGTLFGDWCAHYKAMVHNHTLAYDKWGIAKPEKINELNEIRERTKSSLPAQPTKHRDEELEEKLTYKLREMMKECNLDTVTSAQLRKQLEVHFNVPLKEYKSFVDEQMIMIMGQMELASQIFDYMYLGTEWNASNIEELEANNIRYVLNVTKEVKNFYQGRIKYHNVRLYDVPTAELLPHWEDTFRFIREARSQDSKILVHCKMGVSRSASTVIAYAMKQYNWSLEQAHSYVKQRRNIIKPNEGFKQQLVVYEGILRAKREAESWGEKVKRPLSWPVPASAQNNFNTNVHVHVGNKFEPVTPPDSPHSTPPGSPIHFNKTFSDPDDEPSSPPLSTSPGTISYGSDDEVGSTLHPFDPPSTSQPEGMVSISALKKAFSCTSDDNPLNRTLRKTVSESHQAYKAAHSPETLTIPKHVAVTHAPTTSTSTPDLRNTGVPNEPHPSEAALQDNVFERRHSFHNRSLSRDPSPAPTTVIRNNSFGSLSTFSRQNSLTRHPRIDPSPTVDAPANQQALNEDPDHRHAETMRKLSSSTSPLVESSPRVSPNSQHAFSSVTPVVPHSGKPSSPVANDTTSSVPHTEQHAKTSQTGEPNQILDRRPIVVSVTEEKETPSVISYEEFSAMKADLEKLHRQNHVLEEKIKQLEKASQGLVDSSLKQALQLTLLQQQQQQLPSHSSSPRLDLSQHGSPHPSPLPFFHWTTTQVAAWLTSEYLEGFVPLFVQNGVTGKDLVDMDHDDLVSMGVYLFSERKEILRALQSYVDRLRAKNSVV